MTEDEMARALSDPGIVRHRQKVASTKANAIAFLRIQAEAGSFDAWLWGWVDGMPVVNDWADMSEIPGSTPLSDAIAKDLKKRGMSFVGTTIVYAYLQAVGVVNDHHRGCWRYPVGRGG